VAGVQDEVCRRQRQTLCADAPDHGGEKRGNAGAAERDGKNAAAAARGRVDHEPLHRQTIVPAEATGANERPA
jgi:hypothetical protein